MGKKLEDYTCDQLYNRLFHFLFCGKGKAFQQRVLMSIFFFAPMLLIAKCNRLIMTLNTCISLFFNVLCKVCLLWSHLDKLSQQYEVRIPSGWCQAPFEIYLQPALVEKLSLLWLSSPAKLGFLAVIKTICHCHSYCCCWNHHGHLGFMV